MNAISYLGRRLMPPRADFDDDAQRRRVRNYLKRLRKKDRA